MRNICTKIFGFIICLLIAGNAFSQYHNALRFKITGNGYSDETVVRLLNGATIGFDGNYDAWKLFSPNPSVPSIFTQVAPGQELSINSLPEFTEDVSITIYTNIPVSGSYTINVEEIYALSSNYKVSLTNISSNTHYRILGDTALVFSINAQQSSPTFTFNISTPIVASTVDESCAAMNDGSLMINNAGNTDWEIVIFDNNGNPILNNTSNSSLKNYTNFNPGSYSAQISSKGIVDDINFIINAATAFTADFNIDKDTVYLSEGGEINLTNTSQNAQSYDWSFGDGGTSTNSDPSYTYFSTGQYVVTLNAYNGSCTMQTTKTIDVLLSPSISTAITEDSNDYLKILTLEKGNYQLISNNFETKNIAVYDINGRLVLKDVFAGMNYSISLSEHPSGIYILNVTGIDGNLYRKKLLR